MIVVILSCGTAAASAAVPASRLQPTSIMLKFICHCKQLFPLLFDFHPFLWYSSSICCSPCFTAAAYFNYAQVHLPLQTTLPTAI
ncbi:hypothetical protein HPP92_027809 [Vanilla planifolia]|uniref:Secreted protein n=1 Tax=Vanilla planifolia TaxID=51239 RepID=A0A835P7K2_VANPL|nr:hypothetical protein HPP92_027808 [Vanilla planifolia]KAG0448460.1 hypothetical protein HPP92_027809 [Vanilla planifolia]KAG0448580.1 hypothetical protein HPP92_027750 [Vanilla planifolia]KAG0448581.1 hypothetical protein HPP92_027751 [Vanilla planifolia]